MTINKINTEKLDAKRVFYALCKYAFYNPNAHEFISLVPNITVNNGYNYEISFEDVRMTNSSQSRRSSSLSLVGGLDQQITMGENLKLSPMKNSISSDEVEGRSSGQSTEIEKHDTNDSDEFSLKNDLDEEKSSSGESSDLEDKHNSANLVNAKQFTREDAEKLFKANSTKQFQSVVIQKRNVRLPISMLHFSQYLDVLAFDRVYGEGAAVRAILEEFRDLNLSDLQLNKIEVQTTVAKKPGILNSFMQSLKCCYSPINQSDIAPENVNVQSPIKKSYKVIKSVPHVQKKLSMGR